MTNSLDRVGEWMRMMSPKVYGPRDLREAYMMPREDAVWIMEHCAEVWEKERRLLEEARGMADAWEATEALVNHNAEKVCEYFDQLQEAEADNAALRQRLEEAETALGMLSIERDIAAVEADMHTTDGTNADDRSKEE